MVQFPLLQTASFMIVEKNYFKICISKSFMWPCFFSSHPSVCSTVFRAVCSVVFNALGSKVSSVAFSIVSSAVCNVKYSVQCIMQCSTKPMQYQSSQTEQLFCCQG